MESIIIDLTIYQPASTDPDTLARYRDELRAGAFMSGLKPELANMIRGHVLDESRVMPIDESFSAAIWVHDSLPPSSISSSVDASALVVFGGSGGPPKFAGKGASMGKLCNSFPPCKYCGKMSHQAEKCWKEFGKPAWVLAAYWGKTTSATSSTSSASMTTAPIRSDYHISISSAELAYLQPSRASAMHTPPSASNNLASLANSIASYAGEHVSTPRMTALSASPMSWIIDSGASAHMTGNPSILNSYHPDPSIPDVHIADGRPCPVK